MNANKEINSILEALNETPRLLKELINEIPKSLYKKEITLGKWTIHENATHIAVGDIYGFQKRIKLFKTETTPEIEPLSGDNFSKEYFINLDLDESIDKFFEIRKETIDLAKSLSNKDWTKEGEHPEYWKYTPYIMLRHLLMHDHSHLYKIEDMGYGVSRPK